MHIISPMVHATLSTYCSAVRKRPSEEAGALFKWTNVPHSVPVLQLLPLLCYSNYANSNGHLHSSHRCSFDCTAWYSESLAGEKEVQRPDSLRWKGSSYSAPRTWGDQTHISNNLPYRSFEDRFVLSVTVLMKHWQAVR